MKETIEVPDALANIVKFSIAEQDKIKALTVAAVSTAWNLDIPYHKLPMYLGMVLASWGIEEENSQQAR